MKKRIFFIAVIFALAVLLAASVCAYDIADSFADGNGENETPYIIKTAEQLARLASLVNEGKADADGTLYAAKAYKLGADIIINESDVFTRDADGYITGVAEGKTAGEWTPIGNYSEYIQVSEVFNAYTDFKALIVKYGALYYYDGTSYTSTSSMVNSYTEYYFRPSFGGSFDGDGYTVSGLYIDTTDEYRGLFGNIRGYMTIVKNIGVIDFFIKGSYNIGGVVGQNDSGSDISCCYSTGNVIGEGSVGGIAGWCWGSISDCYNNGTITGNGSVGGITGTAYGTVSGCHNSGTVTGNNDVGGIAGTASSNIDKTCISECYNTGTVTAEQFAGGIAGSNQYGILSDCYNLGAVNGKYYIGGVVGGNHSYGVIRRCYNKGTLTVETETSNCYAGGVVGFNEYGTVSNCYNTGTVQAVNSGVSYSTYAVFGGVVGYNQGERNKTATVEYCYSVGDVFPENGSQTDCAIGGNSFDNFIITSVYYLNTYHPSGKSNVGEAVYSLNLRDPSSYSGFNFGTVWTMQGNADYPYAELRALPHITYLDLNADGICDVTDTVILKKYIVDSGANKSPYDVNYDGALSTADCIVLNKAILARP